MRRSSQVVPFFCLIACGMLTAVLAARSSDSLSDRAEPAPRTASTSSKQLGLLESDSLGDSVTDETSHRLSHDPMFASTDSTTDHAGLVCSFLFIKPWSRSSDQSLVCQHVRLQI